MHISVSASRVAGEPHLRFNRPQWCAYRALLPGQTVCLAWGRGVGKSWFIRTMLYMLIAQYDHARPVTIILLLPTFKQAVDLYGRALAQDLGPGGAWEFLGAKINRTTWQITFPGGSYIQLFGAEHADGARGHRVDAVFVDEADDIAIDIYDAVVNAWFTRLDSLKIRLVAGTPLKGRRGLLYRTYERGAVDAYGKPLALDADGQPFGAHTSIHATGYDVPETVSDEWLEKMRRETPQDRFDREYLCNFDATEGLVFAHYIDGPPHVVPTDARVRYHTFIGGVDWGYEDPFVALVFGVSGSGRETRIHLLKEVYLRHLTDSQIADIFRRLEAQYPGCRYYADPSQPGRIESIRRDARVRIVGADNAIEDGLATVADALLVRDRNGERWSQLTVAPECSETRREFQMYRRRRDRRTDTLTESIMPGNDHAMDALRYALHTHFGNAPGTITSGYEVGR